MLKKILKTSFHFLSALLIFIFQKGFLNGLFAFGPSFNFILVFLVFLLMFLGPRSVFIYAVFLAIFQEIFSFYPPGLYAFSLALSLLIANFFLVNFFTNRSLYSVAAMTVLLAAVFSFFFYAGWFLLSRFQEDFGGVWPWESFFRLELLGLAYDLLAAILIFYALNAISKKVQPAFLIRRK